ncbi:MAG TPA: NTP transferase domain-containing protein [Anaeromyxobacter sp.]|nr:NTP transferase domain-containing protein [Anaeromyxobacter sp.]
MTAAGPGAIVLAAGGSARLGRPKQLLVFRGEPLVRRAARSAVEAGLWPVVVVVGASCEGVRGALAGLPVATARNPAFDAGVAGSIRCGLARLAECAPGAPAVFLLACDQPLVEPAHLAALAEAARAAARPIAAPAAGGLPALFAAALFPELLALAGDTGAEALAARDPGRVAPVPLPAAALDVDTAEDWARALAAPP